MTIIPQGAAELADAELHSYFEPKQNRFSYREAQKLIDNVYGPSPEPPTGMAATDYTRPRITSGGGRSRPSDADVEAILIRHAKDSDGWEEVIAAFLDRLKEYPREQAFVYAEYRDKLGEEGVKEKLKICRATYFRRKGNILAYVVIMAMQKGLIKI